MIDQATSADWTDLTGELDLWHQAGRAATLWWRDDDAASADLRLDRLLAIAGEVPVTLAVIPGAADSGLADCLAQSSQNIGVVQHGWRHIDRAAGGKKSEFPAGRARDAVASDLARGRLRLTELFGSRALAVLAPPWNRLGEEFLSLLPACGIAALSLIEPRRAAWPVPGVFQANVQVDLVAWAGDRGFVGEETALRGLVARLRARRAGEVDREEPTGILTHHLIQDEAAGAFLRGLVATTCAHPAARWLGAREVFAPALVAAA